MDEKKRSHPIRAAFRKLLKNKLATICFFLLIAEVVLVVLAPVISPYHPPPPRHLG